MTPGSALHTRTEGKELVEEDEENDGLIDNVKKDVQEKDSKKLAYYEGP